MAALEAERDEFARELRQALRANSLMEKRQNAHSEILDEITKRLSARNSNEFDDTYGKPVARDRGRGRPDSVREQRLDDAPVDAPASEGAQGSGGPGSGSVRPRRTSGSSRTRTRRVRRVAGRPRRSVTLTAYGHARAPSASRHPSLRPRPPRGVAPPASRGGVCARTARAASRLRTMSLLYPPRLQG